MNRMRRMSYRLNSIIPHSNDKPDKEAWSIMLAIIFMLFLPGIIFFFMGLTIHSTSNYDIAPSYIQAIKDRATKEKLAVKNRTKGEKNADALISAVGIKQSQGYFPITAQDKISDKFLSYGIQKVGYNIPYQTNLKDQANSTFTSGSDLSGDDYWDKQTNDQFKKVQKSINVNTNSDEVSNEIDNIIKTGNN